MFRDAKVGDRVWHVMWGWGKVDDIRGQNKRPIIVQFPTHREEFKTEGTLYTDDIYPSLFWDEVKIIPPPKPKEKAKKAIEGWIMANPNGRNGLGSIASTSNLYPTKETAEAQGWAGKPGVPIFIRHEYEVEE